MADSAALLGVTHADFLLRLDDATRTLETAEEIIGTAARHLGDHLEVERCAYAEVAGDEDTFDLTGDHNRGVASIVGRYRFAQFGEACRRLMQANETYVVEDSESDPRTERVREAYRAIGVRAVICVPMRRDGRFVAAMAVHAATARRWKGEEVALVSRVANRYLESIQRARVGRELKAQWQLFDAALSHTPDFTYIFDREGRFLYINRALLELWRKSFQEAVGRNFHELDYPPELATRLQNQIQEVITTRQRVRDQTPYTGADGTTRHYEYIFVPILAEDGISVKAVAGSTRDITDRLASEEQLRQAVEKLNHTNHELAQFTDVVSHDLQEPLRMVSAYLGLLAERAGADLPAAQRGYIERALSGTQRMRSMISRLLEYARTGQHAPFRVVALGGIIDEAIDNLGASISAAGAVITGTVAIAVEGDPLLLTQVFQNLIGNAIKFRAPERPPRIAITCEAGDTHWTIGVEDNGIGIPAGHLHRVFEVFQRAHDQSSYEGSGIGLAICKKIVASHGGTITIASTVGSGSLVRVCLPRR